MRKLTVWMLVWLLVGCGGASSPVTQDVSTVPEALADDSVTETVGLDLSAVDLQRSGLFDQASQVDGTVELLSECAPGEGCFLDPCTQNDQCQSGWCVEHLGDGVCTTACQEECPPGWSCQQVAGAQPDLVFVCVSDHANLCKPCATSEGCQSTGAEDACIDYGAEGAFCGGGCAEDSDCPWGFLCQEATTADGVTLTSCVAETGVCPCSSKAVELALATPCHKSNESGTCTGQRVCTEDGLTDCDAQTPEAEVCDGIDNDCDGDIDEAADVGGESVPLCDDTIECTKDLCHGADGCSHTPLDSGECKDGDACTAGDHCAAGECVGTPVLCDDGNLCTDDACDGAGGCEFAFNNADCDDGDPCTVADECNGGSCQGTPVSCQCQEDSDCVVLEDGDLCNGTLACNKSTYPYQCAVMPDTVVVCPEPGDGPDAICQAALCDAETGNCSLVPAHEGLACNDGNPCTLGDACVEGTCIGGGAPNCNDGNLCTDDSCDPENGCVHANNAQPCNDGDVCTTADSCSQGECVGGAALVCNDGNICNGIEACDPATGCQAGDPLVCNDDDPCNGLETCQPDVGCMAGDALTCNDGNVCTSDSCQAGVGCQFEALEEGACDDSNACTVGDHCAAGKCVHAGLLGCDDKDVCTNDSCDPGSGCLHLLNTAPCDDGSLCTTGDSCSLGECTGSGTLNCDDGNSCTDDSCDPDKGCVHTANQAACDDGNACTLGDHCTNGWCLPESMLDCDDDNPCTDDACDPTFGCSNTPQDGACDDGDACTLGDTCVDGLCQSGEAAKCDDNNLCTDDSCNPTLGCIHDTNTVACDDGSACTDGDLCADGVCQPGDPVVCDDENICTEDVCDPDLGCVFSANEVSCDDLDPCTEADVCGDAVCAGTSCVELGNVCWLGGCQKCASLEYNGSDAFVEFAEAPSLEIAGENNPVTLEAWMRIDSPTQAIPIHKGSYPTYEYGFAVQDGYIDFRMNDNGNFFTLELPFHDFGTWHHFAGVYDGTVVTLYVDGQMVQRRSHSGTVAQDTYPFRLGRYGPNSGYFFKGAIGTVRVWNRALPQSELIANLGGRFDLDGAENLAGYWPATDGNGTVLLDHSGNGSDGTISGATWGQSAPACAPGATCGDGEVASYEECDDGNGDGGDGCSAVCHREAVYSSCKAHLVAAANAETGYYTIDADGDEMWPTREVYCDMETNGGGWTILTHRPGYKRVDDAATYRALCAELGLAKAGDGVEDAAAWLAQKRMLWATNHPLKQANWPHANAYLAMPVMNKGNSTVYTIEADGPVASLPSNHTGDHCQNVDQHYCGYWYNNGWADANQNSSPDPEDWGDVHDGGYTWYSCMFRE